MMMFDDASFMLDEMRTKVNHWVSLIETQLEKDLDNAQTTEERIAAYEASTHRINHMRAAIDHAQ